MSLHQDDLSRGEESLKFLDQLKLQAQRRVEEEYRLYEAGLEDHFLAFETVVASISNGIVLVENNPQSAVQLRILYVNPAFSQLSGYLPEEILGKSLGFLLGLQEGEPVRDAIDKCLLGSVSGEFSNVCTRRDQSQFSARIKLVPIRDRLRRCTKWLFEIQELAAAHWPAEMLELPQAFEKQKDRLSSQLCDKQTEFTLQPSSIHDPVTGLTNSQYFEERVAEGLRGAKRRRRRLACVLYLAFDLMDEGSDLGLNDSTELRAEVARRLCAKEIPSSTVAHLGGLHFALLFEGLDVMVMYDVINALFESFSADIALQGRAISLIPSIGLCSIDAKYTDALEIIHNAKTAMQQAMKQGGMKSAWYEEDQNNWSAAKARTDAGDNPCIKDIEMRYQPQFDVLTTPPRLCAVKAYAYWKHPSEGLLSPERLWEAAERSGLSISLANEAMRAACVQMKAWQTNVLFPDISLVLEVSESQLTHTDFFAEFVDILAETEIDAQTVYLDISQEVLVRASRAISEPLDKLRQLGTKIVMAHWGKMNSSILPFDSFPMDAVKLDPSFVKNIGESPNKLDLITLVVCYAKSLQISVNAEGVVSSTDSRALQSCGCTVLQGEYLSDAVSPEEISKLLDEGTRPVLERLRAA